MDAQRKLIDLGKSRGGFKTYAAMAERMGVTTATMSQWRSGDAPLAEARLIEICEFAGENAGFWDIAIRAERAKSSSLRKQLQAILKAGGVSLLAALMALPMLGETPNFPTNGSEQSVHYAKWQVLLRKIAQQLASFAAYLIRGESDDQATVLA